MLIDAGANTNCKPENLVQFGIMGSIYMKNVLGIESPTVGLMSNGEEEGKGDELTKETFPLLKKATPTLRAHLYYPSKALRHPHLFSAYSPQRPPMHFSCFLPPLPVLRGLLSLHQPCYD